MKVIAYDPFLSAGARRRRSASRRSSSTICCARADFITLHTPLTDKTRNIINAETLAQDQERRAPDQLRARRTGRRGGAVRRARSPAMSPAPRSTCSRRAGDARARCSACRTWSARRISAPRPPRRRRMSRCRSPSRCRIICCAARSPTPSISPRSAPRKRRSCKPFIALAEKLGSFAGQLTETGIKQRADLLRGRGRADEYQGADRRRRSPGLLRPMLQDVNVVSAPIVAKDRGIVVEETRAKPKATTTA